MSKIFILYSRFYCFKDILNETGATEIYTRNLCDVFNSVDIEPHVVFASDQAIDTTIEGVALHSIKGGMNTPTKVLVQKALEHGDSKADIFIFGTSSLIREHPFKRSIAIQHGIYWDTTDYKGRELTGTKALLARVAQGKRQLGFHSLVSRMVCVDLNYVNWMRALSVANRLPYTYIPNFVDTSTPVPERPHDGRVRVVFARRFEPIRGCGLLMDVMPRVLAEHPEVELAVAGEGSMEAGLHERFDDNPRVTFTRYDADESVAFHGHFDIALVPSVASEGTSLSLLEAMAAGCAVVATDVGGMSNIVLSGHNGLLVRPEAGDLYRAVVALMRDAALRERLTRNARQTAEDSFSRDSWARSWANVLGELA